MKLLMITCWREMIESSGAYTREEPVLSLGRAITEVGELNFRDYIDWLSFPVGIIIMNMKTEIGVLNTIGPIPVTSPVGETFTYVDTDRFIIQERFWNVTP